MGQMSNFNNLVSTRTEDVPIQSSCLPACWKRPFPSHLISTGMPNVLFLEEKYCCLFFCEKLTFWCSLEIAHTFWF